MLIFLSVILVLLKGNLINKQWIHVGFRCGLTNKEFQLQTDDLLTGCIDVT